MNSSCLEILTHFWMEYGTLSDFQIKKNDTNLKKEISGNTHVEEFFQKNEDAQEMAAI